MGKLILDINVNGEIKDFEIEYQMMDNFIFNQNFAIYSRDLNLKTLAKVLLNDMIVSPKEIKNVKFWKDDFAALDELCSFLISEQGDFMQGQRKRKGIRKA